MWERKRRGYNRRKHYSVINKLEREGRLDERTEILLNGLSLEELIAVKLELAAKASGGKIFGIPVWFSITNIVRDACLKFTLSATRTNMEAARFLGINMHEYYSYLKRFKTKSYFESDEIISVKEETKKDVSQTSA